jgi:hypothetical protein
VLCGRGGERSGSAAAVHRAAHTRAASHAGGARTTVDPRVRARLSQPEGARAPRPNTRSPLTTNAGGIRVVSIVPTYNEADVIGGCLRYLIAQGIEAYVIDNWSTDGTWECVQEFLGRGVIGIERFPGEGPLATYEWRRILRRVEDVAGQLEADWFILQDPDEQRLSPWPRVGLQAALAHVDRRGFNCVDHVVLNHWPVDDAFDPAEDVGEQLRYFTFSDHPGHFHQRRAWKNPHCPISIAASAGHDVRFPGRLVYPFKFLLRHFPIRSQEQASRKLFLERAPRWSHEERSFGWHQQYDAFRPGERFARDRSTLAHFEEPAFYERYLIERLSGLGVFREPPPWATGPREPECEGGTTRSRVAEARPTLPSATPQTPRR